MRTITVLSLFVTASLASTRRENNNIRKRSLTTATTPFGNFNDLENDFVLSIVPPSAMHHKASQSSTKSTSPPIEKSSSGGKSGKKSAKGKGSTSSNGKGKGKKGSKKSSSKGTIPPEEESPTTAPEESIPTQPPVLSPVLTPSAIVTGSPQLSPTTVAPTNLPTLETKQAPTISPTPLGSTPSTNLPTPLSSTSTNLPTPLSSPSTSVPSVVDPSRTGAPTASDTSTTDLPTPLSSSSTILPTSQDTSLTNAPFGLDPTRTGAPSVENTPTTISPTSLSSSSTILPTSQDTILTSAPSGLDASRTGAPTASDTSATSIPTVDASPIPLPTGDFETTLNLDQVPPQFHSAFQNAAARWDTIIVGDLEDYPIYEEDRTNPELLCDGDSLPEIVDDVYICAALPEIDGPNGILGSAGPIFGRIGDFIQTSVGYMEFDLADIELLSAQGRLDGLILHEMAHVYGTGTLWGQNGLVTETPDCPYRYDSKASEEYRALSGCDTAVPIETTGGSGTACLHWSESCFQTELMTGVNTGDQELSRMSIATLEDMGYVVDYSQADPFTADQLNPACVCNANSVRETDFQLSNGVSMTFRWNENRRSLRHGTSDKERGQAIQYGKMKLQNNHRSAELMSRTIDPGRIYLADKVLLVLYFDQDEQIKSVLVTSDP